MAALVDLLLQGKVTPNDLVSWLDGACADGIPDDLSPLRVEFVPVFLNFLRDQSKNVLQESVVSGSSPTKAPSSVRVTKYVSPAKSHTKGYTGRHNNPTRGKTLHFSESPIKSVSGLGDDSRIPDVNRLQLESDLSPSTPRSGQRGNNTSTPRHNSGSRESPRGTYHRGKRQGSDGDVKHSEQRLSLADFLSPEVKMSNKKKSPMTRSITSPPANQSGWSVSNEDSSPVLDLSDQDAFPVIGAPTPPQDRQPKRRINPTRVTPTTISSRRGSKGSGTVAKSVFGEPQNLNDPPSSFQHHQEGGTNTLEDERQLLRQERLRRQGDSAEGGNRIDGPQCLELPAPHLKPARAQVFVEAIPKLVNKKEILDVLARVYAELVLYNLAPNIMVELYYILQLLTVRLALNHSTQQQQNDGQKETKESLKEIVKSEDENNFANCSYLDTVHNCVYFAVRVLCLVWDLLCLLDRGTLRLLSEHPGVALFSGELQSRLLTCLQAPCQPLPLCQPKSPIASVSFQTDTDNRNNFPSDQAFQVFRKQRDLFYEMLRVWEGSHLTPGWSFSQALGSRIRQLFSLHPTPTNYAHFSRLFQSQLLTMCTGDQACPLSQNAEDLGFLTALRVHHPGKYQRLYERLVTPSRVGGPCPSPTFPGAQDFFRAFLITADNPTFNCHLRDVLTAEILVLSEQQMAFSESQEGGLPDNLGRGEARAAVLRLRVLAKFLGLLEFLPYQTIERLTEKITASQVALRSRVLPPINLCGVVRHSASARQLVVGVSWVVELLSMVDPLALHSRPYLTVVMVLIAVFRLLYVTRHQEDQAVCSTCSNSPLPPVQPTFSPSSALFLKLILGWFFDLPNFPDGLFFADLSEADIDQSEYTSTLTCLKTNYYQRCMRCLRAATTPEGLSAITTQDLVATTPSKQRFQDHSQSPMKTPSKFLAVGMLASPQVTPNKPLDSQVSPEQTVSLDVTDFVDQQMLTICCPFVSELRNLLSEYTAGQSGLGRGNNSYRKITPLSTPARPPSPTQAVKHLQIQLEDNFFHNQPSSVRKTTDFAAERVSSNIIKTVRTRVIPDIKGTALSQIRQLVDEQLHTSPRHSPGTPMTPEPGRGGAGGADLVGLVERRVEELAHWVAGEVRDKCTHLTKEHCSAKHILPALTVLLPPDLSPQGVEVCRKVVSRVSGEKVVSWSQTHLTPAVFLKDLTADTDKILRQAQKAADSMASTLQVSTSLYDESLVSNPESVDTSTATAANISLLGPPPHFTPLSPNASSLASPSPTPKRLAPGPPSEGPVSPAPEHCDDAPAPSYVLTSVKELLRDLTSTPSHDLASVVGEGRVREALSNVRSTVTQRQDVTPAVSRALQTLTVDLMVALAVCLPALMTAELQNDFVSLWKAKTDPTKDRSSTEEASTEKTPESRGVLAAPSSLGSLLCPRTVLLVAQNPSITHQQEAWQRLEEVTSLLLARQLLTPAVLLDHCVPLLRHTWPQEILSGISGCIEGVSRAALGRPGCHDDPDLTQMLEWVGWVCRQMDDLGDDI